MIYYSAFYSKRKITHGVDNSPYWLENRLYNYYNNDREDNSYRKQKNLIRVVAIMCKDIKENRAILWK